MLGSLNEAPSTQLIFWQLLLNGKISFAIGGKTDQVLEWLWVFQPWFGKNKTVIGTFWTSEHLRGNWKCSKVFLSIQSKKKDLMQWKETESSTPFVVKAATSLFLNSLKFTWKALTFFVAKLVDFKTLNLEFESIGKLCQLVSWADLALTKFDSFEVLSGCKNRDKNLSWHNSSFDFVQRILVLSAITDSPDRHLRTNF